MLYEETTYAVRGACYEVYNTLGPGFKEEVYHNALAKELKLRGMSFVEKKRIKVVYKGETVGIYEPDFVVGDKVVVELKATPNMPRLFETQLYYYLRGTTYSLGLLVNFGGERLEIKRRIYDRARTRAVLPSNPRSSASQSAVIRLPIRGHPRYGQASLEMTLALGGALLLLLGSFKTFLWINERLVRRHQYYNCTRVAAGSSPPGAIVWNDPARRIPLKIFDVQTVSADPCP